MNNLFKNSLNEVFEASVNMSNQAIYWLDKDGKLLFANETALKELGYSLKELQNLHVWDVDTIVNTKEKYIDAIKHFENSGPNGLPNTIETTHKRKDGTTFPVEVVSKFRTIENKEYVISYAKDITHRLQRTEDINFYFELINSSKDMIFLVDHETKIVSFANETACKTLGLSLEELKGMKVSDFRKPLESISKMQIPEVFEKIVQKGSMTTFGVYTTKDKEEIPVETSLHFKHYHDKNYIVAISRDITERMEIELQKEELNKKLTDYNLTLKEEIERAKSELIEYEAIMRKQSRMAAMGEMIENIAHQWRQPLSAVSTLSTGMVIQNETAALSSKEYENGLNKINEHVQYLSKTIDDFRNFFKPDKEKNYFKLEKLLENAIILTEARHNNLDVNFIVKLDKITELFTYESELLQVVLNIINNAIDELLKKDYDKCIIFEAFENDECFTLVIKDNAGGIESSIIDRVFEPYFTTKHSYQGTGIGLYMSKNIVKHMGGQIRIENVNVEYKSKEYRGAAFEIIIPLKIQKDV